MTVSEARDYIELATGRSLSPRTVRRLVRDGRAVPFGSRVRLPASRRVDGSFDIAPADLYAFVTMFASKERRP